MKKSFLSGIHPFTGFVIIVIVLMILARIFAPNIRHFLAMRYFKSSYKGVIIEKYYERIEYIRYRNINDQNLDDVSRKEITSKAVVGDTIEKLPNSYLFILTHHSKKTIIKSPF